MVPEHAANLLIGGHRMGNEPEMIIEQRNERDENREEEQHEDKRHRAVRNAFGNTTKTTAIVHGSAFLDELQKSQSEDIGTNGEGGDDVAQEIAIVTTADTSSDPRTMMIKL